MQTEVLIVGGGLSGLHTAYELEKRGVDYLLIEARERLGGRIESRHWPDSEYTPSQPAFDLGPAWFWPGQKRMEALVKSLNLSTSVFLQAAKGDGIYEDSQGNVQRGFNGASMAGSYRLFGGMKQLINQLTLELTSTAVMLNTRMSQLKYQQNHIASCVLSKGESLNISSQYVVFAIPPRLIANNINFEPALASQRINELSTTPTWMAGHAKLLTFYAQPFWKEQGLSGDAISHRGPLQEIHDASAKAEGPYALFGFIGIPAIHRRDQEAALKQASLQQLQRLFGQPAAAPLGMYLQDWAFEAHTTSPSDQNMAHAHLPPKITSTNEASWDQRIIWSGTETASASERNNGYLEGALEASHRTLAMLENLIRH